VLPRHQTLRGALDWSHELLTGPERVVLRRLGIFAGGFTLSGARAVVADDEIAATEVDAIVASLVAKSLVTAGRGDMMRRCRLLETNRAYAREKLVQSGEFDAVARRHARRYLDIFAGAAAEAETRPTGEWLAEYGPRIDNVRAALDWAFSPAGDSSIGVALTAAAVPLWMYLSLMEECRGRADRALTAIAAGTGRDPRREMQLYAALSASLLYTSGAVSEIGAIGAKALEIAESLEDVEYQLRSLWGLWHFHVSSGEQRVALTLAQRFYNSVAKRSDSNDRLIGERMIGTSRYYLGDLLSARRHLECVLADDVAPAQKSRIIRFEGGGDQQSVVRAYLARILWLLGFPDQAMHTAASSLKDARAINYAISLGGTLALAACPIALFTGDLAAMEHYVAMLLDHSTRHKLARWRVFGLCYQAMLVIRRGDANTGFGLMRAAFAGPGAAGSAPRSFAFLLAEALGRAGQIAGGLATIEEAIVRSERSEERWGTAEFLRVKGELFLLQGAPGAAAAEGHFRQALDLARRQGALSWELRAATSLARLWRDQARSKEAHELLAPVYDRFTEGFTTADLRAARSLLDELT
jgi:predicted ATPase